ncbi:MAG: hypothetical protein HS105_09955 [Chloracidobacterium sp.]|nr:hypothetical protein [Chloracidobacterium sp.]MCO5333750.1 hypothetical protein [Pyrinomonadaceae bacterium]
MSLRRIWQKLGSSFVLLGAISMIGCESSQVGNADNGRLSNAESPTATITPLDSNQTRNTNQRVEGWPKNREEFFAESPPLNIPECIALESDIIERQRKENVPDEEIRQTLFALRNWIRAFSKDDPAETAAACKNMLELPQKTLPRPKS